MQGAPGLGGDGLYQEGKLLGEDEEAGQEVEEFPGTSWLPDSQWEKWRLSWA